MQDKDTYFMQMALELAEKGRGAVAPNPMVGAIIVKDGRIIGSGPRTTRRSSGSSLIGSRRTGLRATGSGRRSTPGTHPFLISRAAWPGPIRTGWTARPPLGPS